MAIAGSEPFVIDDIFAISSVDKEGKKFDRVSRIQGRGDNYGMELLLDVNVELYPLKEGQKVSLALAKSLSLDSAGSGTRLGGEEPPIATGAGYLPNMGPSLADKYEYVMYGRVYKFEEAVGSRMAMYVSFGGLLMRLEADARHLVDVPSGSNLYLLMRKV